MTDKYELIVENVAPITRLDQYISDSIPSLSRSRVQSLIKDGQVFVNHAITTTSSLKVKNGQSICVILPPPQEAIPAPQSIDLDIVYEDDDLLVINKQAGLVVHPGAGNPDQTLVNALLHHCGDSLSGIGGVKRPGIVHRLDKDTTGLMVVAKHDAAHQGLSEQLADRSLFRLYHALVWQSPVPPVGFIDQKLGRHPKNRTKMAVLPYDPDARDAVTFYRTLDFYEDFQLALVECKLQTGRTHQIRVHMEFIGHALLGDPLYTIPESLHKKLQKHAPDPVLPHYGMTRQALHAKEIGFIHPITDEMMHFESDYPDDMKNLLHSLKNSA
jgi:23S rRNA pseudouridine1911/1915/1917 synthase